MSPSRRRRGYVLLMILLLLALASFAMAGLARTSLRASLSASRAQAEVQRRWGAESIERTVLPQSLDLMNAKPPPIRRSFDFTLGGQHFAARLDDEQAKLNVNELVHWVGATRARTVVDAIAGTYPSRLKSADLARMFARRTQLTLKQDDEDADDTDADRIDPAIASFGQLFDDNDPAVIFSPDVSSPTDVLTCWGDGHLDFINAPRIALVESTRSILTEPKIDRLIQIRAAKPTVTLEDALAQLGESSPRLHPLQRRFIGESFCYSLRIASTSGGRVYHWVAVRDESPARPVTWHFDFDP